LEYPLRFGNDFLKSGGWGNYSRAFYWTENVADKIDAYNCFPIFKNPTLLRPL
jgi:hypothetical protein